ncbi:MAG: ABC transporter ATP-binding protein [Opitutae bacterium]|nr:ABC transporter ATP-binding protein [Opitutae bacterium]|tara:strand:+ start:10649 stop:11344 length:696 start_codon:yes stop_codon:yes gene_type:complete
MTKESLNTNDILIRAEQLKHAFIEGESKVQALRGVSFEAKGSEVTAIVGQSGCGKSTLLYLLGLLDRPESGEIHLKGRPMAKATDEERTALRNESIGFVFQFHFLIKELTARENVALPLRKSGVGERQALEQADELLNRLDLGEKAKRYANKLSGGEQQRVAIARALANSPSLLLADEPTGNLDSANSDNVFELLMKFAREKDIAILLVTHNPELAERCDHCIPMRDGLIV